MEENKKYTVVCSAFDDLICERRRYFEKSERKHNIEVKSGDTTKEEYWGFIPCNTETVVAELLIARDNIKKRYPTFLDVGCGFGNIMFLAKHCGFDVHGIEYNRDILLHSFYRIHEKTPNKLWDYNREVIFHGDALDFKNYCLFDVIYMYCPIRNEKLEKKLEQFIEDTIKVGTIFICNTKKDRRIYEDNRFKKLGSIYQPVWKKISN